MKIGGATIDIALDSGTSADLHKLVLDWIATAARAVTTYYTKFPVPQVNIVVRLHAECVGFSGRRDIAANCGH